MPRHYLAAATLTCSTIETTLQTGVENILSQIHYI